MLAYIQPTLVIPLEIFSGTSSDSKKRFEKRTAEWVNSTMSIMISDGEGESCQHGND